MRIFVYGSLRGGLRHADELGALPRAPASVRGALWLLAEGYPALCPDADGARVRGEIVDGVDPARLAALDAFEGVERGLYRRETVLAEQDGERVPCEAWTLPAEELRRRGATPLALLDWAEHPLARGPGGGA